MQGHDYQRFLAHLPFGKRLPNAIYIHRTADSVTGPELQQLLSTLVARHQLGPEFNVVKFRTDEFKLSFLSYACDNDRKPSNANQDSTGFQPDNILVP